MQVVMEMDEQIGSL